ncbi:MAG: aminotransferase class I/II-fold pyridoxal phosphate-dependent enzyme, partial [Acidimicrobiia bacterium]
DEMTIVPVHTKSEDGFRLTPAGLDAALDSADRPIKALLFTNPDNPLGSVSSTAQVEEVLRWAAHNSMHVVANEVYALSVFGSTPFVSSGRLRPSLGDQLHIVWAFSKDFAVSGLRCGVLLTENAAVLEAIDGLAYWAVCSGDTQWLLGRMVADDEWVDGYITHNRARLRRAHTEVSAALGEQGIPHIRAEAGLFLLCDMRSFMPDLTEEAEAALWRSILEQANVNLTPGAACHIAEPGFMRLCFAAEATDAVVAGVRRLGPVLQRFRQS